GQFKDQTFPQIVNKLLEPYGVTGNYTGDSSKFQVKIDAAVNPGESPNEFFKRLAQELGIRISDNTQGEMVFFGGFKGSAGGGSPLLVEGQNIQWCGVTINRQEAIAKGTAVGQAMADDKKWGKGVANQKYESSGSATRYKPLYLTIERG